MTKSLPFIPLPGQEDRLLNFLNRISSPEEITDSKLLSDDPFYSGTGGYSIGEKAAANLLEFRNKLPGNRFRSLEQLLEVKGIGHDKINDLLHSFWKPADEAFQEELTKQILFDNWQVEYFKESLREEDFNAVVESPGGVRVFVAQALTRILQKKHGKRATAILGGDFVRTAYLDVYDSGELGSYAFALWWYHYDMDNWFSFDRMRIACTNYLNYYMYTDNRLELHLVKGFPNGGVLAEAVTTDDLPVIVNYGEYSITIWAASLYD